MNEDEIDEGLEALKQYSVPAPPPSLRENVWRSIGRSQLAPSPSLLGELVAWMMQPRFGVSLVIATMGLGVSVGSLEMERREGLAGTTKESMELSAFSASPSGLPAARIMGGE